jgi:alpha-tubulin suppressor-like RCC1 family protein
VLTTRTATVSAAKPAAGPALAWGDNTAGQLGDGGTASSLVATRVHLPAGTQATAVAAASDHSLAVTSDGRVLSWGGNFFVELGYNGPTSFRDPYAHPVPAEMDIPAGTAVTAVAAGFSQSLALTSDRRALATGGPPACGSLFCTSLPTPVALPAGIRVTAVAAGDDFGLTLSADGRVLSWGFTGFGLMGVAGDSVDYGPGWVTLPARTRVTAIAAGGEHWLALTSAGHILAWGDNSSGDLGNGTTVSTDETQGTPMPAVAALPAGTRVTAIAAGTHDSLALTADGRVFAWGSNSFGQLGDGSLTSSLVPVPVDLPAGTRVIAIAAGDYHNLALTSDGRLVAWGYNAWGQLGDGSTADSPVPVPVELPAGTRVTAIAAGGNHSLVLTAQSSAIARR